MRCPSIRACWKVGCALGLWIALARVDAQPGWTVHEWGTFTSLQDEQGKAIGGINTDDEPVPKFVHRLADFLLLQPTEVPPVFFQGAPHCHPDVIMRLETPVLYFHPPASQPTASPVTVRASFRGGWLSEYYPDALAHAPGLTNGTFRFGRLLADTVSSLTWTHLTVGGAFAGPDTAVHVWTSPRQVQAASVRTPEGESEKFLFYRGVAHIPAPLRISRDSKADQLIFQSQLEFKTAGPLQIKSLWLVNVRPDGDVAFRQLPPIAVGNDSDKVLIRTAAEFAPADVDRRNLKKLEASLRDALVAEGLFADEARALLDTWKLSYFQSAGLRVFFIVPRAWTDHYLPLEVSLPADITRVMVGRVELVTPEQRRALQTLAGFSADTLTAEAGQLRTNFYTRIVSSPDAVDVNAGRSPLARRIAVPPSYRTYLGLGRFRNALILDEAARHPGTGLDRFIALHGLQACQPVAATAAD